MTSDIERLQRHIWAFYFFLTLATLGFIDVVTRVAPGNVDPDLGLVTQVAGDLTLSIAGGIASLIVFATFYVITSFWIIWAAFAIFEWRKVKKLRTTIPKREVAAGYKPDAKEIRSAWHRFLHLFWIVFILKTGLKVIAGYMPTTELIYAVAGLQVPLLFVMAWGMGSTAYRITGKKSSMLYAAFGFFWLAFIGVFAGYYLIKLLRDNKLRETGENPYPKNAGFFTKLLD